VVSDVGKAPEQWSRPVDQDLLGGFWLGLFVGSFYRCALACGTLAQCTPKSARAVTDGERRGAHPAPRGIAQQIRPGLDRFPVPVGQGDELFAAISPHADTKSPEDRPCRHNSGSTLLIFGVLRTQGGRIAEQNRRRWPVSGSTRRSLTPGATTSTAPALVSTSRGW
jgi:hypothetical protein